MTKFKLGMAAAAAAVLAFGVAACGQTTATTEEAPATTEEAVTTEAPVEAATTEAPADGATTTEAPATTTP